KPTDLYQILDENGQYDEEVLNKLDFDDQLLQTMYYWMLKGRTIDKKFLKLQRQGRIGTYGPFSGQEAAQVGSALALQKKDWVVPSYRETIVSMIHGIDLKQFLSYLKGHFGGNRPPKDLNIFPIQVIIA